VPPPPRRRSDGVQQRRRHRKESAQAPGTTDGGWTCSSSVPLSKAVFITASRMVLPLRVLASSRDGGHYPTHSVAPQNLTGRRRRRVPGATTDAGQAPVLPLVCRLVPPPRRLLRGVKSCGAEGGSAPNFSSEQSWVSCANKPLGFIGNLSGTPRCGGGVLDACLRHPVGRDGELLVDEGPHPGGVAAGPKPPGAGVGPPPPEDLAIS